MKFVINTVSNSSRARVGRLYTAHYTRCLPVCHQRIVSSSASSSHDYFLPRAFNSMSGWDREFYRNENLMKVGKFAKANELFCIALWTNNPLICYVVCPLQDHLTYCTVQDPANPSPSGYNMLDKVSVWCRSGKEYFDVERYMDVMECFRPDMYQCLGDGETNINSTNKRIQKSVKRSLAMFHKCLQRHKNSEILKKSAFIAILQGGYDINERIKYAKEIAENPIDGFVIDGLHDNSPQVEFLKFEKVKSLINETLKEFSEDKLRIVHGCWNPETILEMVKLGIDAFDASFPFIATERGAALTFPYELREETLTCNTDLLDSKPKNAIEDACSEKNVYEIKLEDKMYAEQFQPLLKNCKCLCCRQHTRAYIHHLLCSKELLGQVLLMIHNLHHYLAFFKAIRQAVKEESLHKLQAILSQRKTEGS